MLLAVDLDEDFIDIECIAIATVLSLQTSGTERAELDPPQSDCFAADSSTSLGEKIFNIAMAEVEALVEPDCVRNDIWREAMPFVCVHRLILTSFLI
jgi:hypothetical protein